MDRQATEKFWRRYWNLPVEIQEAADKQYQLWEKDPTHPSLHFKKLSGSLWSARITQDYRTVGVREGNTMVWFFIGTHAEYDQLLAAL